MSPALHSSPRHASKANTRFATPQSDGFSARVASTEYIPWRAVHASDAVRIEAEAKLSCDDDTLARDLAQETPEQFLVFVRAVDFGRIQEVAAKLHISAKNSKRFFFVRWSVSG